MHRGIGSMVEVAPYWNAYLFCMSFLLLPPAKVMYLHLSVILFTLGVGVVSQHALQVSRPTPRRGGWGVWPGGVSRPTPGGVSPGPHPGESPGPHSGGVSRPTPGGCIPACTEADTPHPQQIATAAGTSVCKCRPRKSHTRKDLVWSAEISLSDNSESL